MTEIERKELQGRLKAPYLPKIRYMAIWLGISFLMMVVLIGVMTENPSPVTICYAIVWLILAVATLLCGIIAIFLYISGRCALARYRRETVPAIEAMLRLGNVLSKDVCATSVIEIVPFDDEGPGYIFDVGDGKSLLLQGQQYDLWGEDVPWPCTEFQIVRSTDGKMWIGLFCSGVKLEPYRTVHAEECKDDCSWWDKSEEVFSKSPEEVLRDILKG